MPLPIGLWADGLDIIRVSIRPFDQLSLSGDGFGITVNLEAQLSSHVCLGNWSLGLIRQHHEYCPACLVAAAVDCVEIVHGS